MDAQASRRGSKVPETMIRITGRVPDFAYRKSSCRSAHNYSADRCTPNIPIISILVLHLRAWSLSSC